MLADMQERAVKEREGKEEGKEGEEEERKEREEEERKEREQEERKGRRERIGKEGGGGGISTFFVEGEHGFHVVVQ